MSPRPILLRLDRNELKRLTAYLKRCAERGEWRVRLRANAVYFSHQGMRVPEIAQQVKCSTRTVYSWLRRFQAKGMAGLVRSPRSVKLTPQQVDQLMEVSHWSAAGDKKRRKEFRMRWSFRKMAQWIRDKWGIKLSHETVRQMVQPASRPRRPKRPRRDGGEPVRAV